MSCKTTAKQIDEATATSTLNNSDKIPVVSSGTLYSVTFANLLKALGVTGTLCNKGKETGSVDLYYSPTNGVNYFRRLNAGAGIVLSVGSQGEIVAKANLDDAGTGSDGEALIKDNTASEIEFKRIKAGAGISVTSESNDLLIASTALSVAGLMSFNSTVATTISTANTAVIINGTWTSEIATGLSTTTGGRFTYTNATSSTINLDADVVLDPASGTKDLSIYLAKNGVKITNTKVPVSVTFGDEKQLHISWKVAANQNDYFEVMVENNTDTTNINVYKALFRLN